jgi:integrase/recombinase XerD
MRPPQRNNPRTDTTTIHDPLGAYPEQFHQHLERQHYSPATIIEYTHCLNALGRQMKARHVDLKDLDEEFAVELIAHAEPLSSHHKHRHFIVRRFIAFLTPLGVVKPQREVPLDDTVRGRLKRDYEAYLRHQRGLSESTICANWRVADHFLSCRFGQEVGALAAITATDIGAFLQHLTTRRPPRRDKALASRLRNFFRYLFQAGHTAANLAVGIPSVAQRYGTRLPRHLTPAQVDLLVEAVRTDPASGRRNYAMVLLIARLGLRAPEIIALRLDDIDWRSGEILVRGKGQRHDRVPLPPEVGAALAEYIRHDRTTTSRVLFVTERAPHQAFKDGQVLNAILKNALRSTGVTPPAPYVGSHMLRHSLATTLVQRGAPLEEISDMLRHRSRASTMLYAKLDIDGLRSIAQPWPVVGGTQ